jgi:hypothetical protein
VVANKWRQIFRQQKFGGVYKQVYSFYDFFSVHIYISSNNCIMEYGPANDQTRKWGGGRISRMQA